MELMNFKQELYDTLMTIYPRNVSDNQVAVRCPFCGDSRKNSKSTHFGIKINFRDEQDPIMFNCFLCNEGGIMTSEVLHLLEIHDIQITSGMKIFNKGVMQNIKKMGFKENDIQLSLPLVEDNDSNAIKKLYLEKRLGVSFTYEELTKLKTVFSLKQFLIKNDIQSITVKPDKARELNNNYIGWLTIRNEKINFRQVLNSHYKRYEKYNVYNGLDNTQKFYTIPTSINITSNDPIYIVVSEGILDLWGAYYHIFNERTDNMIYSAACGSGYVNVIKYFIRQGLIDNIQLIILSDNEPHRTVSYYKKSFKDISEWVDTITIYYNDYINDKGIVEKDFGVPKSKIKVKKIML